MVRQERQGHGCPGDRTLLHACLIRTGPPEVTHAMRSSGRTCALGVDHSPSKLQTRLHFTGLRTESMGDGRGWWVPGGTCRTRGCPAHSRSSHRGDDEGSTEWQLAEDISRHVISVSEATTLPAGMSVKCQNECKSNV